MEKLRVYINPACSKCKKLRVLLERQDVEVDWVNYLESPLSAKDLQQLLDKMGVWPSAVIRLPLEEQAGQSEEDLLQMMVDNPTLLNRPIVERRRSLSLSSFGNHQGKNAWLRLARSFVRRCQKKLPRGIQMEFIISYKDAFSMIAISYKKAIVVSMNVNDCLSD